MQTVGLKVIAKSFPMEALDVVAVRNGDVHVVDYNNYTKIKLEDQLSLEEGKVSS